MKILRISLGLLATLSLTAQAAVPLNVTMSGSRITDADPTITLELPNAGTETPVTNVFSLEGIRVAELSAHSMSRYYWDGNDVDEQPVPAGIYVIQVQHHGSVWHGPVMVNR